MVTYSFKLFSKTLPNCEVHSSSVFFLQHFLRAVGNLVDNAIEYTPSGGTVFLKGSMTEKSWQLTVFDQGPGFTKEALAHGTKRLWRGDTGRSLDGHRGLGLWIAAQVVKSHSGELELNNWERGGMVTIRMP